MPLIYMCLLKTLIWIILVHQKRQKHQEHHKHAHFMLCLILFFDDRKYDSVINIAHKKFIIELLKQHNIMSNTLKSKYGKTHMAVLSTADVPLHYN